jgi:glycosyltransferase involved in cell wall biosynthesis
MSSSVPSRRVAVITGLPAPYREPVLAELASRHAIDLRVFYASTGHQDVGWTAPSTHRSYDHLFLKNYMPERGRRLPLVGYLSLGLPHELKRFRPDYLIIYGYNQLSQLLAFRHAIANGIPFALRSDSNAMLDTRTDRRSQLRRMLVRAIVRRAHALLPVGSANKLFWQHLGALDSQIFMAPYAVDNRAIAAAVTNQRRDPLGPVRLLYVGRLLPRKGVDLLLSAFNRLAPLADVTLSIVGDGPLRSELQAIQSPLARDRTIWHGKLPNEQAIAQMGLADLFVLPSRYEPWGLVVNEAMAAGLPVIAHRHVGAALDLIVPNSTGWIFDHLSTDDLFQSLHRAIMQRDQLPDMGQQAQERIACWSIEKTVDGMIAAIDHALPVPKSSTIPSSHAEVTYARH